MLQKSNCDSGGDTVQTKPLIPSLIEHCIDQIMLYQTNPIEQTNLDPMNFGQMILLKTKHDHCQVTPSYSVKFTKLLLAWASSSVPHPVSPLVC